MSQITIQIKPTCLTYIIKTPKTHKIGFRNVKNRKLTNTTLSIFDFITGLYIAYNKPKIKIKC